MFKKKSIALPVLLFLLFTACDTSKQLVTRGDTYYLAGNFDDAANYYYNALLINSKNTIAQQGLKKAANIVLNTKFSAFGKYVVENNPESAVRQYLLCKKYYNRVMSVGVELNWPTMYNEVFEDIKNEYVSKQYDEGLTLMLEKKYDKAEIIFQNIAAIDSIYKDASVLRLQSIIEPLYQHGIKMMEAENYKEAYRDFNKVIKQNDSYKNTKYLLTEVLKKASIGVGILPVQNQTKTEGFDLQLYQQIISELVKSKSPFLSIVDRNALDKLLHDQKLEMSNLTDPENAARAGKLIGLQYVLMTALSELQYETAGPRTDSVDAYLAFTERTTNLQSGIPQTATKFKKVKYADTFQKRKVYYKIFYQLVSTQTGQVVASDELTEGLTDENHVCDFNGNINNLYPALPKGNMMPVASVEWREQFGAIKRIILTKEEISREVCITLSQKMSEELRIYIER
ncbi:MAG: hypothetical protein H7296_12725 [Bacteroidia bacterium]|nr:hypothetical protein [Bacteroidia bacterium]